MLIAQRREAGTVSRVSIVICPDFDSDVVPEIPLHGGYSSGPPLLPASAGVPRTARQAAADIQVQELATLVQARQWRQLERRAANEYALNETAVLMLASSRNREARRLVAWRRNLPDDVVQRLCSDRSTEVREAAEYHRWHRGPFTRLPAHPAEEALHPLCPAELLLFHAACGGPWARDRALQHPNLPALERQRIARAGDMTALRALGGNPTMTPEEYQALMAELSPEAAAALRVGYLGNRNGDPAVLRAAVTGRRRPTPPEVRSLAGNPSAPADVLRAVWGPSTSPAELVRNPACPADVLAAICTVHPNADWVHSQAVIHPNADVAVQAAVQLPKVNRDALLTALGRDCTSATQVTAAAKLATDWNRAYPVLIATAAGIAA